MTIEPASLRDSQMSMARYLRDPIGQESPAGIEPRRLKIYEDLVYNNIESFISSAFPVLHSLYQHGDWESLVRAFMQNHRCHSPYFLEISQEFLQFVLETHERRSCDPPFMGELAHYEWVELALDVSEEEIPASAAVTDVMQAVPHLSPLAWSLAYQFPVHRIGPSHRPSESEAPSYLVVYRDRNDEVHFVEVSAATARLLELVGENERDTAQEILARLAGEMDIPLESIVGFARSQIEEFARDSVIWF